jgi:hypothetical protein
VYALTETLLLPAKTQRFIEFAIFVAGTQCEDLNPTDYPLRKRH